ncbi:MAG TPA: pyridoxal 5'-phosphate synthase glutaminase subunit PdxT [Thermoplasmatales archaeon]|nr:pyridoxal 5'-phosphate synthase glutaminase subunit PdxT [Thermoplasmatales archaeon]
MRVSVISAQGDVEEHVLSCRKAMENLNIEGEVHATVNKKEVKKSDAIIIPGGESTTISKLIHKNSLAEEIKKLAEDGIPVMGTCAGCILLAKYGDEQIHKTKTRLLELMDVKIKRNAFGRQRESFHAKLDIKHIGEFDAIFIRAPVIINAGKNVEILAKIDDYIVSAKQENILALSFHPELTDDTRIHEYFIKMGI